MKLALATALSILMITGTFACDFGKQAKSQAPVTVAGCGGSTCLAPDEPKDPLEQSSTTRDERVPSDPVQGCGTSACAKPEPQRILHVAGCGGSSC